MSGATLAPLLIGGVGVLVGAVFLLIGAARRRMIRGWVPTDAVVVRRDGSASGPSARTPTFRWTDAEGREHQRTSMVKQQLGPAPGSTVRVRYDPDDPDRAVIDSFVQSGRVFTLIGVLVIVVALVGAALAASLAAGLSATG